jgi:DNA (cytosine-5)-methyltransferase 1
MKEPKSLYINRLEKLIIDHILNQSDNVSAILTHNISGLKERNNDIVDDEAKKYLVKTISDIQQINSGVIDENKDNIETILFNKISEAPFLSHNNYIFTFIDLFAGIGGFRLAMQNNGGKCTYSSEWDKFAKKTYFENFGEVPFGDITKKETKNYIPLTFDVLCAGFPCQAFSIAGNRKGFSDTRGTLFFEIEEVINKHRPKVVFLENVKNLVSHDNGKTFKIIYEILSKKLGYKVYHKVMNTMDYANIPQNRERIFIVAFDPAQVINWQKFTFPEKIKLDVRIRDLIYSDKQDDRYYYKQDSIYYNKLISSVISKETVYQWRRVYARENKSNVCPTLTANMGTGGHNVPIILDDYGIRKLTPRECFLFQGFPNKFRLPKIANSKLYTQVGNSVTMPLIERIAKKIVEVL